MTSGVNSRRISIALFVLTLLGGTAWWSYAQTTLQAGYTVVRLTEGTQMPVGTAVFSFTNPDGVLVTEAGVGAVEPIARGRIFVDEVGTRTGVDHRSPHLRARTRTPRPAVLAWRELLKLFQVDDVRSFRQLQFSPEGPAIIDFVHVDFHGSTDRANVRAIVSYVIPPRFIVKGADLMDVVSRDDEPPIVSIVLFRSVERHSGARLSSCPRLRHFGFKRRLRFGVGAEQAASTRKQLRAKPIHTRVISSAPSPVSLLRAASRYCATSRCGSTATTFPSEPIKYDSCVKHAR